MNKQEFELLFNSIYPDFFESEEIRCLPEDQIYDEMILSLAKFGP